MRIDRQGRKAFSQLRGIESDIRGLPTEASMAVSRLRAMVDNHQLEKKRILRQKSENIE